MPVRWSGGNARKLKWRTCSDSRDTYQRVTRNSLVGTNILFLQSILRAWGVEFQALALCRRHVCRPAGRFEYPGSIDRRKRSGRQCRQGLAHGASAVRCGGAFWPLRVVCRGPRPRAESRTRQGENRRFDNLGIVKRHARCRNFKASCRLDVNSWVNWSSR